jgi:hypothetical protein
VHLPAATQEALSAYAASGMLAASQDYEVGGMQLPCVVEMAANAFFSKASVAIGGYAVLTSGNANLLMVHGTRAAARGVRPDEFSGRWFGTMCLSEPQAGSSLRRGHARLLEDAGDALGPRYRLRGNKMWISGGDHELTENIVHLVLAKIPGPDGKLLPGTKGISLFIVPKWLVNQQGQLTGERNDVALAGLNHKLGYRGTTNCLLNFGEGKYPAGWRPVPSATWWAGPARACVHVPHDERGAHRRGPGRHDAGLCRLRGQPGLRRQRPQGRAMTSAGKDASARRAHHRTRRRAPHAAGSEELCGRRAGAGAVLRAPGRRAEYRRAPAPKPACC